MLCEVLPHRVPIYYYYTHTARYNVVCVMEIFSFCVSSFSVWNNYRNKLPAGWRSRCIHHHTYPPFSTQLRFYVPPRRFIIYYRLLSISVKVNQLIGYFKSPAGFFRLLRDGHLNRTDRSLYNIQTLRDQQSFTFYLKNIIYINLLRFLRRRNIYI